MANNPIEDLLLQAYPNPQRTGCPGTEKLREMAERSVPLNDALSVHVWHCSPCFEEFRSFRDSRRARDRRTLGAKVAACAAVCCMAIGLTAYWSKTHSLKTSQADSLEVGVLDFGDNTGERGLGETSKTEQKLSVTAKQLSIALPAGSEPGEYDVEIRSGADVAKALRALHGQGVKEGDGRTRVRCLLGSPQLPRGAYVAAWRPHGSELWHYGLFSVG